MEQANSPTPDAILALLPPPPPLTAPALYRTLSEEPIGRCDSAMAAAGPDKMNAPAPPTMEALLKSLPPPQPRTTPMLSRTLSEEPVGRCETPDLMTSASLRAAAMRADALASVAASAAVSASGKNILRDFLVTSQLSFTSQAGTLELAHVQRELNALSSHGARLLPQPSTSSLAEALLSADVRGWWYTGLDENGLPPGASEEAVVEAVRVRVVQGGSGLSLVVLNACNTSALGRALVEKAGVHQVICWETKVEDYAASIFGSAFADALAAGKSTEVGFEEAKQAVLSAPWKPHLPDRPKYELADPSAVNPSTRKLKPHAPFAAGIPRFISQLTLEALSTKPSELPTAVSRASSSSDLSEAATQLADLSFSDASFSDEEQDEGPVYRSLGGGGRQQRVLPPLEEHVEELD